MTKRRPPVSFELALTRIAAQIGWDKVAELAGQAERTVRNWSDPDTGPAAETIPLGTALILDVAYRGAGGDGAPLLQCYAVLLEMGVGEERADLRALLSLIAVAAEEGGEAIAAAIRAVRPGATDAELARAEVELEESIVAKTNALGELRAFRAGEPARAVAAQAEDPV